MIRAIHRKMLRDLRSMRAQVITTGALIACGVSLVVSTWSAYSSLRASRDDYYNESRFADVFADLKRAPLDVARKLSAVPGVDRVAPRIVMDGLIEDRAAPSEEPAIGRFVSIPESGEPEMNRLYLRQGRLPTRGDELEVVVHEGFAKAHRLKPGAKLSVLIQGQREEVRVSGIALSPEYVVAIGPAAPLPDDFRFGIIWVPQKGLERLGRMEDAFNNVTVQLSRGADPSPVKARFDELLRPYGSRGTYSRDRQPSNMFVEDEIRQQKTTGLVTPAIFLGIAAFLVHIIVSRLITMHRGQIATLKAIGYTNLEVSLHYLSLVAMMMLLGAVPGVGLGRLIGQLISLSYASFYRFPSLDFSLNAPSIGIGLVAGILPGLVGAWGSIRGAFALAPAEAMRPPAPPPFRGSLIERLQIQKRLSVPQRMLWRNLLLRPFRLGMTLFGLSMATCAVVASMAWTDIMDFIVDTQFQRIQREDLSVSFLRPIASGGVQELSTLPGVLSVEGYRTLPVRIRYLNHKRELSLLGMPESARMRQLLDTRSHPVRLPDHGILLSRFFETEWGLRAGQTVEIETLEGEPRDLLVPVGGFTDDLVGLSATMRLDELWKTFSEQPGYNLATFLVDRRLASRLYVRLKTMPAVAAVNLKSALYRGFQSTMGKVVRVMSAILISFALVIAGGVIFNSVYVSFSERSWELASLRVIGFSRRQVFRMLMSEVTAQVLVSLIPGCLLGWSLTRALLKAVHTETFGFPLVILPRTYALGILTSLAALALSSESIRRMMSQLSLVDALKARE